MGVSIQIHIDGQTVTPNKTPGWIDEECISGSSIIEINRGEKLPGGCKVGMSDDSSLITLCIVEPKLTNTSDQLGRELS